MRFSLLLSVPAFGEPRIRLHKNIDRVKNIETGSRFQIWGLIVTLPVFKRAIISYPFLPFCNGRCWHQKIVPWPKSEKARQRCPLPSQWMLHMNSKANREVQVSRTCTGEREGASFKSFNNLPLISKVKNQALREQIQSYHELQWSGHALKITLITYRKEDIQMLMSDVTRSFVDKLFTACS